MHSTGNLKHEAGDMLRGAPHRMGNGGGKDLRLCDGSRDDCKRTMTAPSYYRLGTFEARDVTRYMSGNMAQAWQYVFRCDGKGGPDDAIEDLRKAVDFIEDWVVNAVRPNGALRGVQVPARAKESIPTWKRIVLFDLVTADEFGGVMEAQAALARIKGEILRREGDAR